MFDTATNTITTKKTLTTNISIGFHAKRIEISNENISFPIVLGTLVQEFPEIAEKIHFLKGFQ